MIIKKLVKKHGVKSLIILVGDIATKVTPSNKDDKLWAKIKALINQLGG